MSEPSRPLPSLPDRPDTAHKGVYGTVLVVGGHSTMIGAPALAASASVRGGAGLVRIAAPRHILASCLSVEPAATGIALPIDYHPNEIPDALSDLLNRIDERTVLAIGPGMGIGPGQQSLIQTLLRSGRPVVLDADGLNNLPSMADAPHLSRFPLVMTPHPGEFRRIAPLVDVHEDPTDPTQRLTAAEKMARGFRATVVLKGAQTVISDGTQTTVNQTGNTVLATGGSGDVLTGLIAALMAQGMTPFDAAQLGAHLHGLAADLWMQQYGPVGLHPRDLADLIPRAMQQIRSS